jgi:hypothetical protein
MSPAACRFLTAAVATVSRVKLCSALPGIILSLCSSRRHAPGPVPQRDDDIASSAIRLPGIG